MAIETAGANATGRVASLCDNRRMAFTQERIKWPRSRGAHRLCGAFSKVLTQFLIIQVDIKFE